MKLIIVESPAKARTIGKFLNDEYEVVASYGHIRDLPGSASEIPQKFKKEPWARLGVNPEDGYAPIYIVSKDSKKQVAELKKLVKNADEILLATDEDREGEAISWHLQEVLQPKVPVRRITFHEITQTAIEKALAEPRDIKMRMVRAQEGRRILDRLYGYSLSPVLWKKVRTKLSAGRVQSVAVRLVVEKEEERQAFHTAEYFDVEALLTSGDLHFTSRLTSVGGMKLAGGKDFDPDSGLLKNGDKRFHLHEELAARLASGAKNTLPWLVQDVVRKESTQRPGPPFTTSTLQQAASGRLKMSPQRVMRVAQRLYEGVSLGDGTREGLITYMRTDSLTLSEKALAEAEVLIRKQYGPDFTDGPRRYKTKAKGAQEAHEAIRPTDLARNPDEVARYLDSEELALYRLIWSKTLASQMTPAKLDKTAVDLAVEVDTHALIFRANGSIVRFPGFLSVYGDGGKDAVLPDLNEGMKIGGTGPDGLVDIQEVDPLRHETQPPARFTEASLIKKLEEDGIGRPSTYATVISTIQSREYVVKKSGALVPSFTGIAVTHLLREYFPRYVDLKFTALMEEDLDRIAAGQEDWTGFLDRFYRGGDGEPGLEGEIARQMDEIGFPRIKMGEDPATGEAVILRIGRNYVYVEIEGNSERRATLPVDLLIDELDQDKALELILQRDRSREPIGQHPETGQNIYALTGPFGPYLQLGEQEEDKKPKRISLGKKTDLGSIDMEYALRLLSLPREIGSDPETGKIVRAGIGRFGPYVERDRVFASVQNVDTLFSISLEEALERIRNKNKKTVLKELGPHPKSGEPLQILKGRYGPYVSDGKLNGNIGRDRDPEDVTVQDALAILEVAATKKKTTRKKTVKKKTTKKKVQKKKVTKKKVTAKKTTAKKTTKKSARKVSGTAPEDPQA
ncbi:MAG: type I DNA topoisomerase [Gemmatimonadales bacterium]|nr:type I DNA topoisomerase [Gemmatimonadales bacterium]